jgi:hypothetical protein
MKDTTRIAEKLSRVEECSRKLTDGHLTMMRFTTGWKVCLGTPDLRGGEGYEYMARLRSCPTLEAALDDLLTVLGNV